MTQEMNRILTATYSALNRRHLLGSWKQIDPEGRLAEAHWAICLKCGDSIFTYQDGPYRGLEGQCSVDLQGLIAENLSILNQSILQEVGNPEVPLKPLDEAHGHTFTGSGRIHCEE